MAQGRLVDVHPMQFQSFDNPGPVGESKGMDLVYNIPLQVTVELGKTKKEISEILEFSTGTIVVLDKIAGDPVEVVVNGKLIGRGEVVVIDENYGVRITDIVNG
jgi:flagellar motor switch protein FliN/FliY